MSVRLAPVADPPRMMMDPGSEEPNEAAVLSLLRDAGQHLLWQRQLLSHDQPSALDALLRQEAGAALVEGGRLRPWLELMIRAYWACGEHAHTPAARRNLATVLAAFAASMGALEVLDDLADGDLPAAGRQAPNLALALLGESTALLCRLPSGPRARLLPYWGSMWTRCAAAQAEDVALAARADLTEAEALMVARGSGLLTRWAVEAGALVAGAGADLRAPLADFGQHLGAAEKLLHDLLDLWPGAGPARDLSRWSCSLALAVARRSGLIPREPVETADAANALRDRLLQSGLLHYAWACADQCRCDAANALDRFARAGGDPTPLRGVLALPPELQPLQMEDAQL